MGSRGTEGSRVSDSRGEVEEGPGNTAGQQLARLTLVPPGRGERTREVTGLAQGASRSDKGIVERESTLNRW